MNDLELPHGDLPLPDLELDLPEPPAPAAPAEETWSVQIGAIRDPVDAAPAIASILGVDGATAARLCVAAPGTLVEGIRRAEAERIAGAVRALEIAARVEADAPVTAPPERPVSEPPTLASQAPSAPPPGRYSGRVHDDDFEPRHFPSFWPQAPVAFIAPFLGKGSLLLIAAGAAGVGTVLVAAAPGLLIKLGALMFVAFIGLGLNFETFNRLAQSAIARDEDQWLPEPESSLPALNELFFRGLLLLGVGLLLGAIPGLIGWMTRDAFVFVIALAAMMVYWPMALTVMSVSGRVLGAVDFPVVFKAIFTAPLEYVAVCLLTLGAILLMTLGVAGATGVGAVALGTGGEPGLFSGLAFVGVVSFLWYGGIAYFHGVMGYLMGALIRSKGDRFDFLMD